MLFKILHGDASRISTDITPYHEGYCYVTHDGYFYVDMNNQRVKLNSEFADKLRYVKDGETIELNPSEIVTEAELTTALAGKANASHNHDDKYYTEAEIDTKLDNKLSKQNPSAVGTLTIDGNGSGVKFKSPANSDGKVASSRVFKNASGEADYGLNMRDYSHGGEEENNYSALIVNDSLEKVEKVYLQVKNDGATSNYKLYGEHNKPTPADIGAATSSHSHEGVLTTDDVDNLTVKKAKQLNVSDLGNYTNKTIGELQIRINSWLEENFNVGAMFMAKGNWPSVWNSGSSATISDGRTYTATVVAAYQNANYLQLMISTYGEKEIFFVVKEAGTWKNIVKNAFKDDIDSLQVSVDGKAASSHTHDDRYYTESEINAKFDTVNTTLSGKAASSHAHDMKDLEGFFIELNNKGTKGTGHGGYLDFHYDGSGADYTSRIIESASGSLSLNGVKCASSGVTCTSVNITNGATKNKTSGYVKLNNGMILQWGTVSSLANGNSKWVTFPIAFPTAVGGAPMLTGNYGNSFGYELHANDVAATGFTIVKRGGSSTTGTDTVSWLAVGW